LPDGELEDRGTTFTVGADGARTTRVAVEDGQVVLRLRERPPVNVGPGETWTPDVPAPAACASAQPRPAAEASPAPPEAVPGVRSAQPSAPGASTHAADPAADFRVAMDAFDTGNDHGAAIKFGSFLEKHPRDPRAEDAAYLRVIALERCGDSAGVKLAAAEYLRRYPAGFRQAEVEQMGR
jgi:TolA-binding protein